MAATAARDSVTRSFWRALQLGTASDRKVDFCFCIDTTRDATYASKAIALRQSLPGCSLNHSEKLALQSRLLPLSIETQGASIDFEGAILQISTWPTRQSGLSQQDYVNKALAELGALPGILMQGHQWHYVASPADRRTTKERALHEPRSGFRRQLAALTMCLAFIKSLRSSNF
ncbi:hypothetical protein FOQG_14786 [Fusarium oxysporum f. sp. raphani 54005]|uniref:PD-(D/E)XK nuclease-like domain-containing protein n=1 Tax=Fusarium oxysporum f. sp. raphani 54005 TaxID=1089458 RepID=X0BPD4_FUSOX|nr:hypothetical protein FOQG_14786 [Fusarium oxysporum f. sp. raphani 54005]